MGKKSFKVISLIIESLLEIIYPIEDKCIICSENGFQGICPNCKNKIKKVKIQDEILSYGYYGGTLKKLILQFKYGKDFIAGSILVQLLYELIEENNIDFDLICYVPTTKKSLKKKGFNQSEYLARNLSRRLNISVGNYIEKLADISEQKKLAREERLKNVIGAYKITNGSRVKGKKILLIDDVVTTGATLNECVKVLEKCNALKIIPLTIAKSNI